jgi:hypothetical protein
MLDSKHLKNTVEILFNQSMTSKNAKDCPKIHNQFKTKNIPEFRYVFFSYFQGKKTLNFNSIHHIKPFDIKIDFFSY